MQFERVGLVVSRFFMAVEEQQDEHGLCYEQVAPTG